MFLRTTGLINQGVDIHFVSIVSDSSPADCTLGLMVAVPFSVRLPLHGGDNGEETGGAPCGQGVQTRRAVRSRVSKETD